MASAAVLCIGTEITRGEIVNTNATWLADVLTTVGFEVLAIDVTDDDATRIRAALRRLADDHTVVVCTGGLGPTTDDITSECVAAELGVPLERDAGSLEVIERRMARFGRTMAPSNAKQADFPRGSAVLANPNGTAPGFSIRIGAARAFFMPGVPREMKPMFRELVIPAIAGLVDGHIHAIRLKTFGLPESVVNDKLDGVEKEHRVALGYRAHFPEIEVKVLARDDDGSAAAGRARSAAEDVRERLGDVVYGEGEATFPEAVGELLRERRLTLGIAESCTGGLASHLVTERAGASDYFVGSVVSYANDVKADALGVSRDLLEQHGAVSTPVARAMAEGARGRLGADVGLAFTGIAGPGGATDGKPVGLVHFAVATGDGTRDRRVVFPGARGQVQKLAAFAGLALVRKVLLYGIDHE